MFSCYHAWYGKTCTADSRIFCASIIRYVVVYTRVVCCVLCSTFVLRIALKRFISVVDCRSTAVVGCGLVCCQQRKVGMSEGSDSNNTHHASLVYSYRHSRPAVRQHCKLQITNYLVPSDKLSNSTPLFPCLIFYPRKRVYTAVRAAAVCSLLSAPCRTVSRGGRLSCAHCTRT